MDSAGRSPFPGSVQGIRDQFRPHVLGHAPAHNPAAVDVQDPGEEEEAFLRGHVGDVADPDPILGAGFGPSAVKFRSRRFGAMGWLWRLSVVRTRRFLEVLARIPSRRMALATVFRRDLPTAPDERSLHARTPVGASGLASDLASGLGVHSPDLLVQAGLCRGSTAGGRPDPSVVAASADLEDQAADGHGKLRDEMIPDEAELHDGSQS